MSVFGGDSWAREAQQRKRRLDDLIFDQNLTNNRSYKKLSNGKYTCLVCPNNPVLDSSLMLSMHNKGSRHKLKEKDLKLEDEINKRIALSDGSVSSGNSKQPLLQRTRKAAAEALSSQKLEQVQIVDRCNKVKRKKDSGPCCFAEKTNQVERLERRERELKFTAAGWKRDGNGRWFRDENVEFDSDEEDPNICLS